MSPFIFIVLVIIGASFFSAGLLLLSVITASRSSARLAEKYPEIYGEDALAATYRRTKELQYQQQYKQTTTQITVR